MSDEKTLRDSINEWADARGFRPSISFSEATSTNIQRRISKVPGLYALVFANDDVFVGMANDLAVALSSQPQDWQPNIVGVRVMPRSKTGLALVNEAVKLQREAQRKGFNPPPVSDEL